MPKVSAVPGSPQSSTSTVKGSVVVPVGRITEAVPPNGRVLASRCCWARRPGTADRQTVDRFCLDPHVYRMVVVFEVASGRAASHDETKGGAPVSIPECWNQRGQ